MTDPPPPVAPGPSQQLRPPKPQNRLSDEHSPNRNRSNDDLLNRLTPMTAVDILQSPSAELKQCLSNCTVSEQEFAMRAAVASRQIYEWLEELSDWPWPAASGSAGFEMPDPKRRKRLVVEGDAAAPDSEYLGSLPAKDVTRYEERVDDISHDMDELQIEDIKTHVMHSHIIPLSRPGTPLSDTRSNASTPSYNRMDDLTALLTAIIIQALPNLSKLCRLLKVWHVRLSVLRCIPAFLAGIAEAEFALESAWNVLSSPANTPSASEGNPAHDDLARLKQAYTVVKGVLEKQIAKSGRSLDVMLDSLEGLQDTLPDDWLDRMETLERNYAGWIISGERKIQEGEWAMASRKRQSHMPSAKQFANGPTGITSALPVVDDHPKAMILPVPIKIDPPVEEAQMDSSKNNSVIFNTDATPEQSEGSDGEETTELSPSQLQAQKKAHTSTSGIDVLDGSNEVPSRRIPLAELRNEGSTTQNAVSVAHEGKKKEASSTTNTSSSLGKDTDTDSSSLADEAEGNVHETPDVDDELELPPLIRPRRRESNGSESATVVHGHTSTLADVDSDRPEISASPLLPHRKLSEASRQRTGRDQFRGISPPSSPQFRPSYLDDSASPMISAKPDGLLPALPLESSFVEEDFDGSFLSVGAASKASSIKSDDHLRQQISDILDSIPANIKLATATPSVNLNPPPPDLPPKRLRKTSREPLRRTGSSLSMASRASSRAATPYLTLAPAYAKNPRPRRSQSRQDIQVYHLSRSTGEAPIKLFIRCVGEHGERVMVRVGGGWADLGEYLKEYATHHGRRSAGPGDTTKVELQDVPRAPSSRGATSSPPSRPASAMDTSPMTPLNVRKTRRSFGAADVSNMYAPRMLPNTPAVPPIPDKYTTPSSEASNRSRSSSHLSWAEEDSSFLGLAGPTGRKVEMSEESRAWVESVKEKVRLASGDMRKTSEFGDMGKVGGTQRLFRKS